MKTAKEMHEYDKWRYDQFKRLELEVDRQDKITNIIIGILLGVALLCLII